MPIYTKKGDQGKSSLLDHKLLGKDDLHFEALGCLDEANSYLGLARCYCQNKKLQADLEQVQHDLIDISSSLASFRVKFNFARTRWLEEKIDLLEKRLPKLSGFILPGGTVFSSHLHVTRAMVRRAERIVVKLSRKKR
ncbi:MAG: cob(I)yrinic acid a,c-diamide adenosyltransferase [bacterium]|nr:cob(I)yrinic acid a,c-diamide adenosyltransferase [bacterium]